MENNKTLKEWMDLYTIANEHRLAMSDEINELKTVNRIQTEALERLRSWQKDAVVVLNKWYRVSDFLAKNNLIGLGEDYSTKCIEVLKSQVEEIDNLKKQLGSITGSMAAHPDCVEGSEFWDMVRISEKVLKGQKLKWLES